LGWFNLLCVSYGESGGSPLPLRSLQCGTAVLPEDAARLEQLVDMNCLEEAQIENENIWDNNIDIMILYADKNERSTIDFDPFVNAPRMRRFTVARYAADVHDAFCTMQDPTGAQRIALGAVKSGQGHEPAALLRPDQQYPALPIHLRMLEIDLDREDHEDLYLVDDEESDVILDSLVKDDEGTLEGLVLCLPGNKVADDDASGLGKHIELLERTLPRLVNLTELCVRARGYEPRVTLLPRKGWRWRFRVCDTSA
jgi:hypothetical protein